MGNIIFIKDTRVCVKPLPSRLEAIEKLKPPMTVKGYRSFVVMVNFLNLFCHVGRRTTGSILGNKK